MAEIKVNIGDVKAKKTYNKVFEQVPFKGSKVGDVVKGEGIDLPGYELQITGGSDSSGFPMRKDVNGPNKKKILIVGGVGLRTNKRDGRKVRKTVAGNTVYEKTAQINLKVVKYGPEPIEKAAEETKEAAESEQVAVEAPKEE